MMSNKKSLSVDLINGPIMKNLVIFMIPILISYLFQQLYNTVDTAIVGHYLGEQSLAAVGSSVSVFDLMVGFAQGLGNGVCIAVSKAYGAGDEKGMRRAVAGSIVIGLGTVLLMTALSLAGLGPLLRLLGTPDAIFAEAVSYIRIIGSWIFVMFAYNLLSALLRAIGNSTMALVFLIISSVLNVFLDIFLIAYAGMGVRGAAYATVIAQGISAVLCMLYIRFRVKILIPARQDWNPDKALYAELAGQGYAMAFMSSVVNLGSVILQSGINGLGEVVIAGHTTARKIFMLSALPGFSMGMAVSTFVSQNRGAGKRERIIRGMKESYVYDLCCGLLTVIVLFVFGGSLARMVSGSSNPELIGNVTAYVRFAAVFSGILAILHQTRMALQGLGSKTTPLISSFIELAGKCVFTYFLVPRLGYTAVIMCEPLIWCVMTVHLVYAFFTNPYIKGAATA